MLSIVALVRVSFGLEVVSGKGRVEVVVLADLFALRLLHEVDIVNNRKKHILDVIAAKS